MRAAHAKRKIQSDKKGGAFDKFASFLCAILRYTECRMETAENRVETARRGTAVYEDDGIEAIAALVPPLCAAGIVAEEDEAAQSVMRALRRKGVLSVRLGKSAPPENVRLIVSVGGDRAANGAKRTGAACTLPVFVLLTTDARTAIDGFFTDGALRSTACPYPVGAAIYSPLLSPVSLPRVFGGICAACISVCDVEAAARLSGKPVPSAAEEKALDLIYEALSQAKKGRACASLLPTLIRLSLQIGEVGQANDVTFTRGGADDCARAATLLFRKEGRAPLPFSVFAFLFGQTLARLYCAFSESPPMFCAPPDDNLRAARLGEFLGLDPLTAAHAARPRRADYGLTVFRLREYREEVLARAQECVRVFSEAGRLFRRLFPDDGFSLSDVLDESDMKTVIALAPDLFAPTGTLLGLMRDMGVLDRYLPKE